MSDSDRVRTLSAQISYSLDRINRHFAPIRDPEDFLSTEEGHDHLDVVTTHLHAIGENLKILDKVTGGELFARYPDVDRKQAMRTRDVISHHHYSIDAEIVYDICLTRLPGLRKAIEEILAT